MAEPAVRPVGAAGPGLDRVRRRGAEQGEVVGVVGGRCRTSRGCRWSPRWSRRRCVNVVVSCCQVGGGRRPGGDVGGAGAGRAEVDVAALHPAAQRVRGVGLDGDGLGALGVVAAGRGGLERRRAAVDGRGDGGAAAAPCRSSRRGRPRSRRCGRVRRRRPAAGGAEWRRVLPAARAPAGAGRGGLARSTTASGQWGNRGGSGPQHGPDQSSGQDLCARMVKTPSWPPFAPPRRAPPPRASRAPGATGR